MNWKSILLGILTLVLSFLFIWITKSVFALQLVWWKTILYPGLTLIPFLSFWGLFLYLVKNRWLNYFLAILIGILTLVLLGWNYALGIAILILIILTIIAHYQIQSDIKSRLKIFLDKSLSAGLKIIFFALSLLIAIIFFYTPWAHLYDEGLKIPANYQIKILSQFVPGFHKNITVDEMILLLSGIPREEIKEKMDQIPSSQLKELREQTLEKLGLKDLGLTGSEKISENPQIINQLLMNKIQPFWQKTAGYIPILLAFAVFEIAVILGYILIPLSIFIAFSIYQLMLVLKLITIKTVPEQKETLEF